MLAAAHVNWHYVLILLLPSVVACVVLALTWYSRAKRRGASGAKPRGSSAAKHIDPSAAKHSDSPATKSSRSSAAKHRPK